MTLPNISHFLILEQLISDAACHILKSKVELFANVQNSDLTFIELSASWEAVFRITVFSYCLGLWWAWGKPVSEGLSPDSPSANDPYRSQKI